MSLVRIKERAILLGQKLQNIRERNIANAEKPTPLKPIVEWKLDTNLEDILRKHTVAIGSVVAAGHMPDYFSDDALRRAGLERNNVDSVTPRQIELLHEAKPNKTFRFIDSKEAIRTQEAALHQELEEIYNRAKTNGVEKVLFSVCAISAGFDLNYANALLRLMDEKGADNIVFSIFLPFNRQGVTEYSVSGQGVNPQYWVDQWTKFQDKAKEFPNSIFIHEPTIRQTKGEAVVPEATPGNVHERGKQVNNNVNSVYSDVNRMLVYQALLAAKGNVKKVRGIFAEAFQTSNALLGGGPEVMAMLLFAGVPLRNLDIVQAGLTEFKKFGRTRALIQYLRKFRPLMKAWDSDPAITAAWGPDYAPLRRRK